MALAMAVAMAAALAVALALAMAMAMAVAMAVALALEMALAMAMAMAMATVKPVNTTFALLKSNNFRRSLVQKMAKILGGIKKYGKDTPIPIAAILNFRGLSDAICALRAVLPECEADAKILARKFACKCVRETMLPDGRRVWDLLSIDSRKAVETAESFILGKVSEEERLSVSAIAWREAFKPYLDDDRRTMQAAYAAAWCISPEDDVKCWIPGCNVVDVTRRASSIVKWGANNSSIECSRAAHPRSAKEDHFKFFRQLLSVSRKRHLDTSKFGG